MGFNFGRNNGPTAATVAAVATQTAVAPAALTVTGSAGATYTSAEQTMINALKADITAVRTQVAALVVDMTAVHTFENALRTSLRNAAIVA